MSHAGDMAAEMDRILSALAQTRIYLAGLDQADAARELADRPAYSPLRTRVETAEEAAQRVQAYLRGEDKT